MHLVSPLTFCSNRCFQLLPGITVVPREIDDKSYAKFWDKQGAFMIFVKIVNSHISITTTARRTRVVCLSFELICCYLLHVLSQFQALGRTKTCCGYDDRNLAPSNIKKQFHDTEEWRGNLTAFYGKRFFKLGIRREQDRPARKKSAIPVLSCI